jgi:hypothetical protein
MTTTQTGQTHKMILNKKTDIISLEETTASYNLINYHERGKNYGIQQR